MCTVTFIPAKNKHCITSNRDEKFTCGQSLAPVIYSINERNCLFPKDAKAGGTWIAVNESGNAAVLLNGAFEKYTAQPP